MDVLNFAWLFFVMLAGHALSDYPLQGEFLSVGKNRHTELGRALWRWLLPAHAIIHGAFVAVITGSLALGLAETFAHGLIDFLKCDQRISFDLDQWLHVACKAAWALIACFVWS